MEINLTKLIFFRSQAEFRSWLKKNHNKETEIWIGMYNAKSAKKGITYKQALDEALCFGWIDGIRKSLDKESYVNRFTPRKAKSYWSEVNTKRYNELLELGLVHAAGSAAFEANGKTPKGKYSFEEKVRELSPAYEKIFKKNMKAWEFFIIQPPSYRKAVSWYVMSAKREETQLKRLEILINDSGNGLRMRESRKEPQKK